MGIGVLVTVGAVIVLVGTKTVGLGVVLGSGINTVVAVLIAVSVGKYIDSAEAPLGVQAVKSRKSAKMHLYIRPPCA